MNEMLANINNKFSSTIKKANKLVDSGHKSMKNKLTAQDIGMPTNFRYVGYKGPDIEFQALAPVPENLSQLPDPSLLSAARENNIDLVRTLLEQCADPNIKDDHGNTALHLAALNKDDNKWLVKLLLEYGADIDSQDKYGSTCLMFAAENNNIEIVRCLLQNGADINKKDKDGNNVLHYAAENKNDNKLIIELLLLKDDAVIDGQNDYGRTCLMFAAVNNNIEIVRCLLQNDADKNEENLYGEIAIQIAKRKVNKEIVELLLNYKK